MGFFNYHMPPFISVMGFFYVVIASPFLLGFVRHGYWQGVFSNLAFIVKQQRSWFILFLALELIVINYLDVPVSLGVKDLDQHIHAYTFWDFICSCAEGGFIAGLFFSIFMVAEYFHQSKLSVIARISLMSSIYGGLANALLKFIFNRQRPAIGLEPWHFFAFFESGAKHFTDLLYAYNSMPSGHTISTLAGITPLILAYRHKMLRLILIIWAILVNFSRVYTLNHWLSDVIMATVLGSSIGLAVYRVNCWRIETEGPK